jgi:hypothetical protein
VSDRSSAPRSFFCLQDFVTTMQQAENKKRRNEQWNNNKKWHW